MKLAIICEHLAKNPDRKAFVQRSEPLGAWDSGIVLLCADGENPCSEKSDLDAAGLLSVCAAHFQKTITKNEI